MKRDNVVVIKSRDFAIRIIKLYKFMCSKNKEFVLSKQLLRSGTSIGANIKESQMAQSKADFIAKIHIALKEASETEYWLDLLYQTEYLTKTQFESMNKDIHELISLLTAILKSAKEK